MQQERERDAAAMDEPGGTPPDRDLTFDPTMTEGDEANIPPESAADPEDAEVPKAAPEMVKRSPQSR